MNSLLLIELLGQFVSPIRSFRAPTTNKNLDFLWFPENPNIRSPFKDKMERLLGDFSNDLFQKSK